MYRSEVLLPVASENVKAFIELNRQSTKTFLGCGLPTHALTQGKKWISLNKIQTPIILATKIIERISVYTTLRLFLISFFSCSLRYHSCTTDTMTIL